MEMNARTRKALEGSIKKWTAIVEWRGEDKGPDNCNLCKRFPGCFISDTGERCPVYRATGTFDCMDSPYMDWVDAVYEDYNQLIGDGEDAYDHRLSIPVFGPRTQRAAEAELKFLISLLPEE